VLHDRVDRSIAGAEVIRPPAPPYFDGLIAAYRAGQGGRDVHLGYWDRPPSLNTPCAHGEFDAAQARLTGRVIGFARPQSGQRILDVGCGLGGTLAAIAAHHAGVSLVGLNIDRRQLELCRGIAFPGIWSRRLPPLCRSRPRPLISSFAWRRCTTSARAKLFWPKPQGCCGEAALSW
jgi:hypothetical protein